MNYKQIIGQGYLKKHLQTTADKGIIPHAQIFLGKEGYGTLAMAIAYAADLLSRESKNIEATILQCSKLLHPDLHFVYPVATTDTVKKHPVSKLFLNQWRTFVMNNPYADLLQWYQHIGIEKKQGQIGVDETTEIVKTLSLKSYSGGIKVMIFWCVDKMNITASNKLLKLIEEPSAKTVLILITEKINALLDTVVSRCQILNFRAISEKDLIHHLTEQYKVDSSLIQKVASQSQGNYNRVLQLINDDNEQELFFEKWFVAWVRIAFAVKNEITLIESLIDWNKEITEQSKEMQKAFITYCLEVFRQALLYNYTARDLVFFTSRTNFSLENFSKFIHSNNIIYIYSLLNESIYKIERNVSAKSIWLNLSIKLTRLLHTKE